MRLRISGLIAAAAMLLTSVPSGSAQGNVSRFGGAYSAWNYAYGLNADVAGPTVAQGFTCSSCTATLTVVSANVALGNGYTIQPFSTSAPITILDGNRETVTPTAVSSCYVNGPINTCQITASFAYPHGQGATIGSGTAGLAEAAIDAARSGGGSVTLSSTWANAGTTAEIVALAPEAGVTILDLRGPVPQIYATNLAGTGYQLSGQAQSGTIFGAPVAITAGGAVPITASRSFVVTDASAASLTLAAPVSGAQDGLVIAVTSATAAAHTITATGLLNTGSSAVNEATFAAFAGANLILQAYGGHWMVVSSVGVTFS